MTILDEVKLISRTSKQCRAIARYLEEHAEVDNVTAIMGGIPDAGRVLRLGARIFEIREAGYEIEKVFKHLSQFAYIHLSDGLKVEYSPLLEALMVDKRPE